MTATIIEDNITGEVTIPRRPNRAERRANEKNRKKVDRARRMLEAERTKRG